MKQKDVERHSLIVSALVNGIMGIAGIVVYIITGLSVLLLDGAFSMIAFLSTIVALYISTNSHKKTKSFPQGMYFLEPIYAIFKASLNLALMGITLIESGAVAYAYFIKGIGKPIETGPILPYTILMIVMCFGLGFYNRYKNKQINNMSSMINAESKSNFIDGILSGGVGIAILMLQIVDVNGKLGFLHYTGDFFIMIILVCLSLKEPLRVLITSFKELVLSPTDDVEMTKDVVEIVNKYLETENDRENTEVHVYKQGMKVMITIFVKDFQEKELIDKLRIKKMSIRKEIRQKINDINLEIAF